VNQSDDSLNIVVTKGTDMKKIILALAIVIATVSIAAADTFYLRDGRTVRGTLLGFVNGRFVVRVENRYATTNTDSNIQRNRDNQDIQYFRPEEIDRIEIEGRSMDEARWETKDVQVTLESNWIDSGVFVRRGERVQVSATGVITAGRSRISPDGLRSTDPSAPLPTAAEGKLIGAIGNDSRSPILEIGSNREFTAERGGRLFLTANRGSFADARGAFSVQIKRERSLTARDTTEDREGGIRSRERDGGGIGPGRRGQNETTVEVAGNSRGTDTRIDVRAGEPITISATGTIVAGTRVGQVGPDGAASTGLGINARPVPSAGVGALIAYIRMANGQLSPPYLVGSNLSTSVPMDGRLILAVNDDNYNDNSGSFSVRIRY